MSHEDLVNLFSTALYGSSYLEADYDADFYKSIPKDKRIGDCFEDKLADVVLNGGQIYFYDNYAEGEVNSTLGEVIDNGEDEPYVMYTIHLENIIEGLEACCNKKRGDWEYDCFNDFENDGSGFDLMEADVLLQNILFLETIYG